jgi:lauroyl/myristoyl acyltransferase
MTRRLAKKIIRRVRRGDNVGYTVDQRYAAGQRMWRAFKRMRRVTVTIVGAWVA